ncbi:hypothetical protein [Cyanobium sp. Morenito 9A2]|uniref:hypothetical protein n=1 Tax=Cyanobium sp. Morenito 9A2 TaxID=2823718 RepID=UPI0020CCA453|nr:hypothetical protein [Cyanobium sp. Morenito 9A2]MCP9850786.1 hypothetical protein [Cyanobium sp. Morenito 9A2]
MEFPDAPSPAALERPPSHPLLIAAVLVWLSVDLIGDGILAVLELLGARTPSATVSRDRQVTPS